MFNRSFLRRKKVSQLPQTFLQYSAAASSDYFGISCALSNDGATAIVGQDGDNTYQGSAVVLIRSGVTWTEQTLLTQSGGATQDQFGRSVALSSDGNTAICGVPYRGATNIGEAVVFTRSGITWTQQAVLANPSPVASDLFGWSVDLSSDGNTAIVGAIMSGGGTGKAVVFTRSGITWTQQAVLTRSSGSQFGYSVALSSDGNTAIVGSRLENCAVVFTRSVATWTQEAVLTYSPPTAGSRLGASVDLSSDGNMAIVGAPQDGAFPSGPQGFAVVFTRSGGVWTQQATITRSPFGNNERFGQAVSLSGNKNIAIIGGPYADTTIGADAGVVVVFSNNNGVWTQQSTLSSLSGIANERLGDSIALSTDGNIAIAGAPYRSTSTGDVVVFYNH